MNFKDIPVHEIQNLFILNNLPIPNNLYQSAVDLINEEDDLKYTNIIKDWLFAFEHKHQRLQIIANNNVLKFLHVYAYILDLPLDILGEIIVGLDYQNFKCTCKHLQSTCKQLRNDPGFGYKYLSNIMLKKGYTQIPFDFLHLKYYSSILLPSLGKVTIVQYDQLRNLSFFEPIVKMTTPFAKSIVFITSNYKGIFMNEATTKLIDINIPIHDIAYYNKRTYILSEGKVYYSKKLYLINLYKLDARSFCLRKNYMERLDIDNVIAIKSDTNFEGVRFLKTNNYIDYLCGKELNKDYCSYNEKDLVKPLNYNFEYNFDHIIDVVKVDINGAKSFVLHN